MKNFLHWAPRILGILGIMFISLFSLDVFQPGMPVFQMLQGFAIHLIPSILLLIFLSIAWKFEFAGGIIFILVSFVPFLFLNNLFWTNAMLSVPFLLTGILFILSSWHFHQKSGKSTQGCGA